MCGDFLFFPSPGALTERRLETSHRDENKVDDHKPLGCKKTMIIKQDMNESALWTFLYLWERDESARDVKLGRKKRSAKVTTEVRAKVSPAE